MRIKVTAKWLIAALGAVLSTSVMACVKNDVGGTVQGVTYLPFNTGFYTIAFNPGQSEISVPLNAPVGTVLLDLRAPALPDVLAMDRKSPASGQYIPLVDCGNGSREHFYMPNRSVISGWAATYPTGVANIGYRAYYPGDPVGGEKVNVSSATSGYSTLYFPADQPRIQFVLLSHDWSGNRQMAATPANNPLAQVDAPGWNGVMKYLLSSSLRFVPEPCKFVTDTNMRIELDPVPVETFPGTGVRYKTEAVSLEMQCPTNYLPPSVKFEATPYNTPASGVIANGETFNAAQGVGVLLEYLTGGAPSPADLSGTSKVTSFTNLGNCGTGSCQRLGLDLQASYIRMAENITPGSINSRVTITVEHN